MSENVPHPVAPTPEEQITARLARIEHWIARLAHTVGNHSAQFDAHVANVREELAQIHGGLLLVDGTTARLERRLFLDDSEDRPMRSPRKTPTDQFSLPAGVTVAVPRHRVAAWLNAWRGLKIVWYVSIGVVTLSGWALHLWRMLARR